MQTQIIKRCHIHRLRQKYKVQQPLRQLFLQIISVGCDDIEGHLRVTLFELHNMLCNHLKIHTLDRTNRDCPLKLPLSPEKFLLRLVHQRQYLLEPLQKLAPVLRKLAFLIRPDKQLRPQLFLQLHDLAAQIRLSHVKQLRRLCDALLLCNGHKILHAPKLHPDSSRSVPVQPCAARHL